MKRTVSLLLALLLLTAGLARAEEALTLVVPSPQEATIAPGRDFYLIARVDDSLKEQVRAASVRLLDANGKTVREARTGAEDFAKGVEGLVEYEAADVRWPMPELLYDAENPESLADAWRKCYYKDGYVVSYITGGRYEGLIAHLDEKGKPLEELSAGAYTARVEVELRSGAKKRLDSQIVYAHSPDIVISRFSPAAHLYNVTAEADARGYRLLLDPLPGYWTPASLFKDGGDDPYSAEFPDCWRYADGLEYAGGDVHFYLYNVSPTSTTQSVELAILQADGTVEERLRVYRYDIGEPSLAYQNLNGEAVALTGTFTPLEKGDKLELCRAEIYAENRDDNALNVYAPETKDVDIDLSDGVTAAAGQYLAFVGMTAPLQNAPEDLIPLGAEYTFQSANRVTALRYTFRQNGIEVMTAERQVGLQRAFSADWTGESIYEFSHVFALTDPLAAGAVEVRIEGFDAHGAPVAGAVEDVRLTIE